MTDGKQQDVLHETKPTTVLEPSGLRGQAADLLTTANAGDKSAAAGRSDAPSFLVMSSPFDGAKDHGADVKGLGVSGEGGSTGDWGAISRLKNDVGDSLSKRFGEIFPDLVKQGFKPPGPGEKGPPVLWLKRHGEEADPQIPKGFEGLARDMQDVIGKIAHIPPEKAKELALTLIERGYKLAKPGSQIHLDDPIPGYDSGRSREIPRPGAVHILPEPAPSLTPKGRARDLGPEPGKFSIMPVEAPKGVNPRELTRDLGPAPGKVRVLPVEPPAGDGSTDRSGANGSSGRPGTDDGNHDGHQRIGAPVKDRFKEGPEREKADREERDARERRLEQKEREGLTAAEQRVLVYFINLRKMDERSGRRGEISPTPNYRVRQL